MINTNDNRSRWLNELSNSDQVLRIASHINEVVNADHLLFALIDHETHTVKTFCYLIDGQKARNITYSLFGTPCEQLSETKNCIYYQGVADAFPRAPFLTENNIESYIGYPLTDERNHQKGLVAALYKAPKKNLKFIKRLFTSLVQSVTTEMRAMENIQSFSESLESLKAKNMLFDAIHDAIPEGLVTIDNKGVVQSINRGCLDLFGYEESELIGKNVTLLMPDDFAKYHDGFIKKYESTGSGNIIGKGRKLQAKHKSGDLFDIQLHVAEVNLHQQKYYLGYIQNITRTVHLENQLKTFSSRHPISKLPNMYVLKQVLTNSLGIIQLTQKNMYCAVIYIERFERIQHEHGEGAELKVIEKIAQQLRAIVPQGYTLFHVGLNTFYIVCTIPISSTEAPSVLEQQVMRIVESCAEESLSSINVALNIGSFCFKANALTKPIIWALLDEAKKHINASGELRSHRLTDKEVEQVILKEHVKRALPEAVAANEFSFVVQPQVHNNEEILSAELLMRWQSPTLGFVSPGIFIPIAEEGPEILTLSHAALHKACEIIMLAKQNGQDVSIAVNISAHFLTHSGFETSLISIADKYGIKTTSLILEITESTLIKDMAFATALIHKLSAKGFRFSIDDFGTGYSSLSYLKEMRVHELKIDKSFITNLEGDTASQSIVKIIIELGRAIKANVVAEGVETERQAAFLSAYGCNVMQGFLFHKPMQVESWQVLNK
ncbi:EAL domain-containing protein [Alteromonas sediminis]|uniref:Sensor protein FixL n=1 Tax=Alteromonas sediminis TaxID=2259342 RepID=A0A3N5YF80_9ALTE|nr:GGDEF domain-containing phosphodiesterase [Alteromonas sediminis]RPJ68635.1 EAL domain-containing protein [Alteromonas sediminis]